MFTAKFYKGVQWDPTILWLDSGDVHIRLLLVDTDIPSNIFFATLGGYTRSADNIANILNGIGVKDTLSVKMDPYRPVHLPRGWLSLEITLHFEFVDHIFKRAYATSRTHEEIAALLAEYRVDLNGLVHTPLVELIIQYIE
jgi:hypothetical protein